MLAHSSGYAALCIVGPVAWGLVVYAVSNLIEDRLSLKKNVDIAAGKKVEPPVLPLEYHI